MAETTGRQEEEEKAWEMATAAADDGRGIDLRFVNLNSDDEMQEVFDALDTWVSIISAKSLGCVHLSTVSNKMRKHKN
jgi:hypothetical protein